MPNKSELLSSDLRQMHEEGVAYREKYNPRKPTRRPTYDEGLQDGRDSSACLLGAWMAARGYDCGKAETVTDLLELLSGQINKAPKGNLDADIT